MELWMISIGVLVLISVVFGIFFFKRRKKQVLASSKDLPQEIKKDSEVSSPSAETKIAPSSSMNEHAVSASSIESGLEKTKSFFQSTFDRLFQNSEGSKFFEELEEAFLLADVGIDYSEKLVTGLKKNFGLKLPERKELKAALEDLILNSLPGSHHANQTSQPKVILVVGVNGAGKTTTIAKLCQKYKESGSKVLVGAADTFRAAATEQLKAWTDRLGIEGVFQKEGADPAAVAFDSVQAAKARNADVCIIDTAGRLHNKVGLMEELKKMKRVVAKADPTAPHEIWLVVDGSTGQNALFQTKEFHQNLGLTGVIVTKLDGSAKGGSVLAVSSEFQIPVLYIGIGESAQDLIPFEPQKFVETILSGI